MRATGMRGNRPISTVLWVHRKLPQSTMLAEMITKKFPETIIFV